MAVLLAALAGCCPPSAAQGDSAAGDSTDPFVADHQPDLDAAGFSTAFQDALSRGLPLPQTVFADYRELLDHGDGSCPTTAGSADFDAPHGCTSAEGYTFRGSAGILVSDTRTFASDGSWTGAYGENSDPANYTITRADGTALEAGGTLATLIIHGAAGTPDEGVTTWSASITGTFRDDGQSDWMAPGYSGDLDLAGSDGPGGVDTVDGAVAIGGVAIQFEALTLDPATCPDGALSGALSLRQDDSTWYVLTLPDGCGSCGALTWDDATALGDACVDLAPVVTATAACAG